MSRTRAVLHEIWGLFVDDGWFALWIVVWLAVGWILPRLGLPGTWSCILFAVGPAGLLIVSTVRQSTRP
jgi:hypothetical protein